MIHRGQWPRAIEGYLSARAFGEAADAIEVIVQDTFDAGNWDSLKGWIDALPKAIATRHPRLLLFRAKVHSETGELNQAFDLLKCSHQAYMSRNDQVGAARALVQQARLKQHNS